jgi:hypothetical protein
VLWRRLERARLRETYCQTEFQLFGRSTVKSLMQGYFVYVTGQHPLEVRGFSDCFAGPKVDNRAIRQLRAANFCAGVKDYYAATPKTYPKLIRSSGAAPMDPGVRRGLQHSPALRGRLRCDQSREPRLRADHANA